MLHRRSFFGGLFGWVAAAFGVKAAETKPQPKVPEPNPEAYQRLLKAMKARPPGKWRVDPVEFCRSIWQCYEEVLPGRRPNQLDDNRWYSMKRSVNPAAVLTLDRPDAEPLDAKEIERIHAEWESLSQGPGKLIVGKPCEMSYERSCFPGHLVEMECNNVESFLFVRSMLDELDRNGFVYVWEVPSIMGTIFDVHVVSCKYVIPQPPTEWCTNGTYRIEHPLQSATTVRAEDMRMFTRPGVVVDKISPGEFNPAEEQLTKLREALAKKSQPKPNWKDMDSFVLGKEGGMS